MIWEMFLAPQQGETQAHRETLCCLCQLIVYGLPVAPLLLITFSWELIVLFMVIRKKQSCHYQFQWKCSEDLRKKVMGGELFCSSTQFAKLLCEYEVKLHNVNEYFIMCSETLKNGKNKQFYVLLKKWKKHVTGNIICHGYYG